MSTNLWTGTCRIHSPHVNQCVWQDFGSLSVAMLANSHAVDTWLTCQKTDGSTSVMLQ